MSQRHFSLWHVLGLLGVLAVFTAAALAGGVFLGYQWGRAAAVAAQPPARDEAQAVSPALPLPDFGPFADILPERPYLGVTYAPVTPELAEAEDLAVTEGALVRAVAAESPAEAAGLQPGDVIQRVNGQAVDEDHDLRALVADLTPGQEVTLSVLRDGESLDLNATVGTRLELEPVLPAPLGQSLPGQGWRVECMPPEPCRLVPLPASPEMEPAEEDKSLNGLEKQHQKPASRVDGEGRSLVPARSRPSRL